MATDGRIQPRTIEQEMKQSYLDYAMSVIVSRALPDVRDGLKPVQRRILYGMDELGVQADKPTKKSARIVGDVMGRYHPHGDAPIYDALVRMAQDFSFRYPLVDGQGNFGCFTGDTTILLLDGTERSFAELAQLPPDRVFHVFSVDGHGRIVVGEARRSRITRRNAPLVEVLLDNGRRIRCTPDHLFMLRDGTYKEAQRLTPADSLMACYFDTAPVREGLNEYLRVLQPTTGAYEFVHHLADRFNEERGLTRKIRGPFVRHHKNFNRWDNTPSNIERMGFLEHLHVHAEAVTELWVDEAFRKAQREGVRRYHAQHPEVLEARRRRFRDQNRDTAFRRENGARVAASLRRRYAADAAARDELSRRMRALWSDPDYRARMSAVPADAEKRPLTPEEKRRVAKIISEKSRAMWGDGAKRAAIVGAISSAMAADAVRARVSEGVRRAWQNPACRAKFPREHFSQMAYTLWEDPATRAKSRELAARLWQDPNFRALQREAVRRSNARRIAQDPAMMANMTASAVASLRRRWADPQHRARVLRTRIARYASELLARSDVEGLTPEVYEANRTANWVPRPDTALRYFGDFAEIIKAGQTYNHRVVSVRWLDETADVYDITVDEHHNFLLSSRVFVHNSVDGDPPAAMRYTEARLSKVAMELLADIDKETVDFAPNFDQTMQEPTVLPARVPNLLLDGAAGIAVGMATNIPPHNLREIVDALTAVIDDKTITVPDLMKVVRGPDFPTGGLILGKDGIRDAYTTGRGAITVRAKASIEELRGGREAVIVTELPYMVNKAAMIERIADLVREKKLQGVSDLRDESDRRGMRVVIELARGTNAQIVLNRLYKHTQMQTTFGAIMLALVDGVPRTLNLKQMLEHYLTHRRGVVTRRTKYELAKAEARAHILEGLRIALDHLDAVIALIRKSKDVPAARAGLMKTFKLSEEQSQAILDMRLQRLTALERTKIDEEYKELIKAIAYYQDVLRNPRKVDGIIKGELSEVREKYGDERRTRITGKAEELDVEDLIPDSPVVITLTHHNYVKRLPLETYRSQRRGGRGVAGLSTREEDFVEHVTVTTNHVYLLFFTNRGKVYRVRAHEVPEASRQARGVALVNLVSVSPGERVNAVIALRSFEETGQLFMVTKHGVAKKTGLMEFLNAKRGGIQAVVLDKGDDLVGVKYVQKDSEIVLATRLGQALRFKAGQVREMGRAARGVRGIRLRSGDEVVGVADTTEGKALLTVTSLGFGKRTPIGQYPIKGRGGVGVVNLKVAKKNGEVVAVRAVDDDDEVLLISERGIVIRCEAKGVSLLGRAAQGVKVMRLDAGDRVAGIAVIKGGEE